MDPLEEFIRKNKESFDDKIVPEGAWKNIERSMGINQRTLWNSVTMWRAAAIIFMAATGYLLIPKDNGVQQRTALAEVSSKEFTDVETYYIQEISAKVELIDKFHRNEGLNGFTHDFQQLEAMYMVLKEQMKTSPSEKVKDALVLNLLVRIDLLNQHLHKLDKEYKKGDKREDRSV